MEKMLMMTETLTATTTTTVLYLVMASVLHLPIHPPKICCRLFLSIGELQHTSDTSDAYGYMTMYTRWWLSRGAPCDKNVDSYRFHTNWFRPRQQCQWRCKTMSVAMIHQMHMDTYLVYILVWVVDVMRCTLRQERQFLSIPRLVLHQMHMATHLCIHTCMGGWWS